MTFTFGLTVITNASAYVAGFFAYYPKKKNVDALTGWGISVGASASIGIYLGVGRFINADTTDVLANLSGVCEKNMYTYCANDTVNDIDPTGELSYASAIKKIWKTLVRIWKKLSPYLNLTALVLNFIVTNSIPGSKVIKSVATGVLAVDAIYYLTKAKKEKNQKQ